jgi:hypothetical protein
MASPRHAWLAVLNAFEVVIVEAATLLSNQCTAYFGWTQLGLTLLANVFVSLPCAAMRVRPRVWHWIAGVSTTTIFFLAAMGIGVVVDARWTSACKSILPQALG